MAAVEAHVLLIEDSDADAQLMMMQLKEWRHVCHIYRISDGTEALQFLFQKDKYLKAERPDLIILDLNIPKVDGRQVLKELKNDADLRQIPVIIFTSSSAEEDVFQSYDNHANCYMVKPMGIEELETASRKIEDFWLDCIRLPKRTTSANRFIKETHASKQSLSPLPRAV